MIVYFLPSSPLRLIYQPLLDYDPPTKQYKPAFADELRIDEATVKITVDGRTAWHDGTPVSLADVIYSLELYQRLKLDPLLAEMTLSVLDETHLDVVFPAATPSEKTSYLLSRLFMLPRRVFTQLELQANDDSLRRRLADPQLIGSGPYRLLVADDFVVRLERRSDDDALPRFVELPRYGDTLSRQRAVELGLADLWYGQRVSAANVTSLTGDDAVYAILLNAGRPSLDLVNVRRALSFSFRRSVVVSRLEVAEKRPFISYQYFGTNEAAAALDAAAFGAGEPRFSPGDAARIMSEAGMRLNQKGQYELAAGGAPLELVYQNRFIYTPMLEQFVEEAASRGFAIALTPVDEAEYRRRRETYDFDLMLDVYLCDDRPAAVEARVDSLLGLLGQKASDAKSRLANERLGLYANAESDRRAARQALALELQAQVVILPLEVAPFAFLNRSTLVWPGDATEAVGAAHLADPFGLNWPYIFKSLGPAKK